jgi:hypothetical protein
MAGAHKMANKVEGQICKTPSSFVPLKPNYALIPDLTRFSFLAALLSG